MALQLVPAADLAEAPSVLERAVPCAPRHRLHISWGAGHMLRLVDCAADKQPSASDGVQSTATTLRWFRPSDTMRKVGYDVQPHYEKLQQRRNAGANRSDSMSSAWLAGVQEYSRTVSTVMGRNDDIREPQTQITEDALVAGEVEEDPAVPWQRALWELLEIFFVEKGSTRDIITEDLGQWLRRNWSVLGLVYQPPGDSSNPWAELRQQATEGDGSSMGLESHPQYWACMHKAVALGWMGMAEDLLSWHSAWRRSQANTNGWEPEVAALEAVQSLLRSMPHFCREGSVDLTGRAFTDLPEFLQYRQGWVHQCQQFLFREEFNDTWEECRASSAATADGLRCLLEILSGNEAVLQEALDSWLELLVAQILHCYPHLKPQVELKPLMDRCIELSNSGPSETWGVFLQSLLEAAADRDAQTVVAQLQGGPAVAPWFLCHAADILATAGDRAKAMLYKPLDFHGCTQVEHYSLDYAMSLMPYPATWQLAASYLSWCPSHGLQAMRKLLERLPVSQGGGDKHLARKIASICRYHGELLLGASTGVSRTVGVGAHLEGQSGAAVDWLLRGYDGQRASMAIQDLVQMVDDALQEGSSEVPLIAQLAEMQPLLALRSREKPVPGLGLGTEPQGRGWLEFLFRYQEFSSAVAGTEFKDGQADGSSQELACVRDALFALLRPGVAPHHLWPALVFRAVPLLDASSPPLFSHADTVLLQSRLAEAQLGCKGAKTEGVAGMHLHVARLAVVRHLARTHVLEVTSGTAA